MCQFFTQALSCVRQTPFHERTLLSFRSARGGVIVTQLGRQCRASLRTTSAKGQPTPRVLSWSTETVRRLGLCSPTVQ